VIKARIGGDFDRVVHRALPFLRRVPLHPDLLTGLGVAIALGAGIAFSQSSPRLGGLLLIGSGLCDLLDGVLARAQGLSSRAGAFLDSSMDRIGELFVFAGIGVGFATSADPAGLVLALWALGASFMTSYTRARAEQWLAHFSAGWMERAERVAVLILGALLDLVQIALVVIAVGATATAIQRIVLARRLLRELEHSGRDPTAGDSMAVDRGPAGGPV
jgi:phosphatidylglycerophosphate synthase